MLQEVAIEEYTRMKDFIEIHYHGELAPEVIEYIQSTGAVQIRRLRPLTLVSSQGYEVLPGVLRALSLSPTQVVSVRVRFGN